MTDAASNPFVLVEGCRYGRFLVPPTDTYVGQGLLRYGEYSQVECELLLQLPIAGTRVVCVGANMGALVVPIAQQAGEVIAFEPQRWLSQLLAANCVLNGLSNVRVLWAASGAARGTIHVHDLDPAIPNNFGALHLDDKGQDIVPVIPIDDVVNADMALLTIDVEGMELEVLQGAEATLARCRPIIFFEADRAATRSAVFAWLRARRYALYWYVSPLYNLRNFKGAPENIYHTAEGQIMTENVLAVPIERGFTLPGFKPVDPSE